MVIPVVESVISLYCEGVKLSAANLPIELKRKTEVVIKAAKLTQPRQQEQKRPVIRAYKFQAPMTKAMLVAASMTNVIPQKA